MTLDESRFHALAEQTIDAMADAIEDALGDVLDVDIDGGVLSIGLADGGQYIINKNAPLCQVWLSSPRSGAWHFTWDETSAAWLSTRHAHVELKALLASELEGITGSKVTL